MWFLRVGGEVSLPAASYLSKVKDRWRGVAFKISRENRFKLGRGAFFSG